MTLGAGKKLQNGRTVVQFQVLEELLGPSIWEKKTRFKELPVPGISKNRRVS